MVGQDSLALAAQPPAGASAELCPPSVAVPPFSEIYKQYFDFVWSSAAPVFRYFAGSRAKERKVYPAPMASNLG